MNPMMAQASPNAYLGNNGTVPMGRGLSMISTGYLDQYDAQGWRLRWYTAPVVFNRLGLARLTGILAAT